MLSPTARGPGLPQPLSSSARPRRHLGAECGPEACGGPRQAVLDAAGDVQALPVSQPGRITQATAPKPTSHPTANSGVIQHPYCRAPPWRGEIGYFGRGIIDRKAEELIIFFRGLGPVIKSPQERMINKLESLAFKGGLKLNELT